MDLSTDTPIPFARDYRSGTTRPATDYAASGTVGRGAADHTASHATALCGCRVGQRQEQRRHQHFHGGASVGDLIPASISRCSSSLDSKYIIIGKWVPPTMK
jgi:hypothetical protein